jgi:FAD/FMN-containing dehydrogenase
LINDLTTELTLLLGADSVLKGDEAKWRMPNGSQGEVLVLPDSTKQVSGVLKLCQRAGRPLVAQGGLTGLVGGAVSAPGDVALSFERMRRIEEVDPVNRCMTVEAGVTLQAAQEAADKAGMMLPLDLGARGTATIGGNVSTNAGGTRVLRFGMMREVVLGLEIVLADGTVLNMLRKIIKNNSGYDLKHLFIGSEGTLGLVTRAVLRLRSKPASHQTALAAVDDFTRLVRFLAAMEVRLAGNLSSFEVMWRSFYDLVTTTPAQGHPILERGHSYYVLVETLGTDAAADHEALVEALHGAQSEGLLANAAVAYGSAERQAMWSLREDLVQLAREGPFFAYDVSLPLDAMEAFVADVQQKLSHRFKQPLCWVYGHLADGNLHLAVHVDEANAHAAVDAVVYGALSPSHSSVSAEHGIGLLKKPHLACSRTEPELDLMRAIKRALDPQGILNPGKIFDTPYPYASAADRVSAR